MNSRIYINDWLEFKPYEKQTITDSYYLKICNDVKSAITINRHSFGTQTITTAIELFNIEIVNSETLELLLFLKLYDHAVELKDESERYPRNLSAMAIAEYFGGDIEKSNAFVNELEQKSKASSIGSPLFYLAAIYAQKGETEKAFEALHTALSNHELEMYWLKVWPLFEPLHDDMRWERLMEDVYTPLPD